MATRMSFSWSSADGYRVLLSYKQVENTFQVSVYGPYRKTNGNFSLQEMANKIFTLKLTTKTVQI